MRFPSLDQNLAQRPEPGKIQLRDDLSFASTKMAVFQYVAVPIFLFPVTGFWELQIKSPDCYNEQAERNRIKSLPIVALRGKILDRDDRVIVGNHSTWSAAGGQDGRVFHPPGAHFLGGTPQNHEPSAADVGTSSFPRRFSGARPYSAGVTAKSKICAAPAAPAPKAPTFISETRKQYSPGSIGPANVTL